MEKLEVTGCMDCPFKSLERSSEYYCNHPKGEMYIDENMEGTAITPGTCPLYKSPITISIKQND